MTLIAQAMKMSLEAASSEKDFVLSNQEVLLEKLQKLLPEALVDGSADKMNGLIQIAMKVIARIKATQELDQMMMKILMLKNED